MRERRSEMGDQVDILLWYFTVIPLEFIGGETKR